MVHLTMNLDIDLAIQRLHMMPRHTIPILDMPEASAPELHELANTGSATLEVATSEFPGPELRTPEPAPESPAPR
jgi:hypothetical protein